MEFTFDDFVALMGHTHTGDPLQVLEAWDEFNQEQFLADLSIEEDADE